MEKQAIIVLNNVKSVMKMKTIEKELRERFISDMNIPLQVYHSPYFEERIVLMNDTFNAKDKWEELKHLIDTKFDSSPQLFLEEYHNIRDKIIITLSESKSFINFANDMRVNVINNNTPQYPNRNLYTCDQTNNDDLFLSIDLKKANFSALRHYDKDIVLGCETYEELIYKFTDLSYIAESKYTRQVIFGKLNPKKTTIYENFLIKKIIDSGVINVLVAPYFDIFSVNSDEIIFKLKPNQMDWFLKFDEQCILDVTNSIKYTFGLDVKVEKFKLLLHQFKLGFSDVTLNVFEKENFNDDKVNVLKNVSSIYYPQVYKLLNHLEITENDLVFYNNHELAKFIKPIKLITC